jgi:hypothetical protein
MLPVSPHHRSPVTKVILPLLELLRILTYLP